MTDGHINAWQEFWGETYGPELKQHLLGPVFAKLEAENKIGDLIVDVGSGAVPVTQLLKPKANRKRICVDIAADGGCLTYRTVEIDLYSPIKASKIIGIYFAF
jgi:hypothetical protein